MEISKEKRYEDLVNAVAGGELQMVKFLWNLVSEIDDIVAKTPQSIVESRAKQVDAILKRLRENPAKDGERGMPGPRGIPGKDGAPGRDGRDGQDGADGLNGIDGKDGKDGAPGLSPRHEWDGSKIRFQSADGTWGEWVDVRGPMGPAGMSYGPGEYGGGGGLERVRSSSGAFDMQGVSKIMFGNNLTITRMGDGSIRVDALGGASGTNLLTEEIAGTQSGANVTLDLTTLSQVYTALQFVTRQGQILSATDYSLSGDVITIFNADAASEKYSVQVTY